MILTFADTNGLTALNVEHAGCGRTFPEPGAEGSDLQSWSAMMGTWQQWFSNLVR
jgi:hypothetical protein